MGNPNSKSPYTAAKRMKIESHLVVLLRIGSWVPAGVGEREVEGSVGPLQTVHRSCKRSHIRQKGYTLESNAMQCIGAMIKRQGESTKLSRKLII